MTRRIELSVEDSDEYAKHAPPGMHFAWFERKADVIHVVAGYDTPARVGHELWHALTGEGNSGHHPAWHLCIPALVPVRFWRHAGPVTRTMARKLVRDRYLVVE